MVQVTIIFAFNEIKRYKAELIKIFNIDIITN